MTDTCYIKHRLANSVYPQVLFNQRVLQRSGAEWRETEPGSDETERLAQVTCVEKHHTIGASKLILPHGARKYCRHQK